MATSWSPRTCKVWRHETSGSRVGARRTTRSSTTAASTTRSSITVAEWSSTRSSGVNDGAVVAAHDVLIVGGGLAGLRAAIAVAETDPTLDVALVSKVYPMRSHSVSAEGGAAGAVAADDSLDEHAYDTISGSDWLGDQDAIEAFVTEAPRELLQLEHWGCPWSRQPDGHVAVRAFGGMKKMRTWFAADKTGFHMLHALFQTTLKYREVKRYDEWFVTRLLVDDGRVHGLVAVDLHTGRIQTITAKAVILATGGC